MKSRVPRNLRQGAGRCSAGSRPRWLACAVIAGGLPAATYAVALVSGGQPRQPNDPVIEYTSLSTWVAWGALTACVVAATVLAAAEPRARRRLLLLKLGGAAAVLPCVAGSAVWFANTWAGVRRVRAATTTLDGERYRVAYSSALGRVSQLICRDLRENAWLRESRIVAMAGVDRPGAYASILLPRGSTIPPSRLVVSPDGLVLAVYDDEDDDEDDERRVLDCFVAYHPLRDEEVLGESAAALSPFVLFGEADTGSIDDVESLAAYVAERAPQMAATRPDPPWADPGNCGVPLDAVLESDLRHANPWVRDAARQIVEAGGELLYPISSARVREGR